MDQAITYSQLVHMCGKQPSSDWNVSVTFYQAVQGVPEPGSGFKLSLKKFWCVGSVPHCPGR